MTWDYRLVDFKTHIGICEVYYDGGRINGRTGVLKLSGDTADDIREEMAMMLDAFDHPTLDNDEHFSR